MGIALQLVSHDELIAASAVNPIIINDLSTATTEDKKFLDNLTTYTYNNTDVFSNEPHCSCMETRGGYKLGVKCPNCLTPVREAFDHVLKPLVWMRSPNGVAPLMNPMIWTMLTQRFTKGNFSIIEWLCNTDYQPLAAKPDVVDDLLELGVQRGYNNFVRDFDTIMDILFNHKAFKTPRKKEKGSTNNHEKFYLARSVPQEDELHTLLKQQRHCIFSRHLPLPNKSLLIIENTQVGTFVDPIIIGIKDAIRTIESIDTPLLNYTLRQKENRAAKAIALNAAYHYSFYQDIMASKNGIFRKHGFGTREHFSGRAVISSNTKAHQYNGLLIPWGLAVTMLKVHLQNKLMKMGYNPNQCTAFLQEYTTKTHPLLRELFDELIRETPGGKGIACTFGRNPSLTRGSLQKHYIIAVKEDVDDNTISLPILDVVLYNA